MSDPSRWGMRNVVPAATSIVVAYVVVACIAAAACAADVEFDVTNPDEAARWTGRHDVGKVVGSSDGLRIEITGSDPYLQTAARDYPADAPLLLEMRLRSETGGTAQVFYFRRGPAEGDSVRFAVPGGRSFLATVALPPLGPGYRLRFDPPGTSGACTIERLRIVPRRDAKPAAWPAPEPFVRRDDDLRLTSGSLSLRHARAKWSAGELTWNEKRVALLHSQPLLGILVGEDVRWVPLAEQARVTTEQADGRIVVSAALEATDLPRLKFTQTFITRSASEEEPTSSSITRSASEEESTSPDARARAIDVTTTVEAAAPCDLLHVPLLVVLPGLGTHGARKSQALFAGVEYLSDEPSRSTADLEGAAANRLVPAPHKLTFPLMAVQHDGYFVSLSWTPSENTAALFDSPDRTLGSDAHALGLIAPGAGPTYRADGELVAYRPLRLVPGQPLRHQATIAVGAGTNVTAAVQDYVARRKMPAVPAQPSLAEYVRLASAGWLDAGLREGDRYRHAVGNGFAPQPALDAAWMLAWLGELTSDAALRQRLRDASRGAAAAVPPGHEYHAHVGHLKHPVAGLTIASFENAAAQARATARGQLAAFPADGIVRYQAPREGIDFGRTQPSREASGLAGLRLAVVLEAAAFGGDDELMTAALDKLRALDRYDGDVPRGAQTWEIPLHTPDILASAHLVRAYALAFRVTGDARWLERARYWAWTGVPFVYLRAPTDGPVGAYATTAVLGATQWQQPVWIGLPVQWCGLVYADSLRWLEPHDPGGPWKQLADGITASAIAQSYPLGTPRQGLLPDSFDLLAQQRNPADINPGTLQPLALQLLTGGSSYDVLGWPELKTRAYAPGKLSAVDKTATSLSFRFSPWNAERSQVVVHGLRREPRVTLDGAALELRGEQRFVPETGTLILTVTGKATRLIMVDGIGR